MLNLNFKAPAEFDAGIDRLSNILGFCRGNGITVTADLAVSDARELPELVILPGGMPGALNLRNSSAVTDTVLRTYKNGG